MSSPAGLMERVVGKVPIIDIALRNVSVVCSRPSKTETDTNVVSALWSPFVACSRTTETIHLLKDVTVTCPAGKSTLVRG